MFKMSKKRKHIHILDGMSLYTRDRSPFYWGYLNIEGKIFKKSLKTDDRKEAERFINEQKTVSPDKLIFLKAISNVVKSGMDIVGVDTPDKM